MRPSLLASVPLLAGLAGATKLWPSPQEWAALNATVGGRLHEATPVARPCFADVKGVLGSASETECAEATAKYLDHVFRADRFAGYMNTEWETCQATSEQCLLDWSNPANSVASSSPYACEQGSISNYYIDVQGAEDVQAAFVFSKSSGVNIVVKNTGHDYSGRSSGPNTLGLWVHNLQSVSYVPQFVAQGADASTATPAVTFGAGVVHQTLYEFAEANNLTLPGGADGTVGAAGGYLMGGGHSAVSNALGLAVDRVLEFEVVTPNGQHLFANAAQNTDLFFALRGGGGGTFGVVLQVTMKALPKMEFAVVMAGYAPTAENRRDFLEYVIAHSESWAEQGWGGYISPLKGLIYANPVLSHEDATASLADLKEFTETKLTGGTFMLIREPTWFSFFNHFIVPAALPVGAPFITTSRLIPADNFRGAEKQAELLNALIPVVDATPLPIIFANTPVYFKGDGSETSVSPAWRKSLWHITASGLWNFNATLAERQAIYDGLSRNMDRLRDITPGSGAYHNEADVYEPHFSASFWGDNYPRLLAIKKKYDPDHLLDCWRCVDWKGATDEQYKCYIPDQSSADLNAPGFREEL